MRRALGLAIGFEYGPMNVTRLGIKGELVRCSASRGVVAAEREQSRCSGTETAIGSIAYDSGNDAVRTVFGKSRKRSGLTYDVAVKELADKDDAVAKAARAMGAAGSLKPATSAPSVFHLPESTDRSREAGWFRMIWYFEDPARSKREREAIERLASQVSWMTPRRAQGRRLVASDLGH